MGKKILIAAACLLLMAAGLGGLGYWMMYGVNTPDYEETRYLKVPPGAPFEAVVDSLQKQGILKHPATFTWIAQLTGWKEQVKPGHYAFESGASNHDLLDTIRKGLQTPVRLTIPPGSRAEVVAEVVSRQMYFSKEDFLTALKDSALAAEVGTDTLHLFGYMMPETYFVYWLSDAPSVVKKIKSEFDSFFSADMRAGAERQGLTVDEVLRVASIVEWETNHVPEKPTVAGVYLNRLKKRWRLDADPTVQYALLQIEGRRRRLLYADYRIQHPYNTYLYRGLPPGPVTNPSPSSVEAVVNPEEHDYMFFVATGDGRHTFTRTLREHVNASQAFHRLMRQRRLEAQQQQLSGK